MCKFQALQQEFTTTKQMIDSTDLDVQVTFYALTSAAWSLITIIIYVEYVKHFF